jgi:hypothetical protein
MFISTDDDYSGNTHSRGNMRGPGYWADEHISGGDDGDELFKRSIAT